MLSPSSRLAPGTTRTESALATQFELRRDLRGRLQVRDASGAPRLTDEVNDMILVWHGAGEPDFRIGPCAELSDRRWTGLRWGTSRAYATSIVSVQRDVVDNDHFGPVHHLDGAETTADVAGPFLDTVSQGIMNLKRLGGPPLLCHIRLTGRLHGLGLLTYRTTITLGTQLCSLVLSAPTPIDANRVRFHVGIAVLKLFPGGSQVMRYSVLQSVLNDIERDALHWEATPAPGPSAPAAPQQERMFSLFDDWLAPKLASGSQPALQS